MKVIKTAFGEFTELELAVQELEAYKKQFAMMGASATPKIEKYIAYWENKVQELSK